MPGRPGSDRCCRATAADCRPRMAGSDLCRFAVPHTRRSHPRRVDRRGSGRGRRRPLLRHRAGCPVVGRGPYRGFGRDTRPAAHGPGDRHARFSPSRHRPRLLLGGSTATYRKLRHKPKNPLLQHKSAIQSGASNASTSSAGSSLAITRGGDDFSASFIESANSATVASLGDNTCADSTRSRSAALEN